MLYAFFWVIPRRLNFICRRFGTLYLFYLHRQVGVCRTHTYLPMKMELPRRKHTTFRTWRKFEIKNVFITSFVFFIYFGSNFIYAFPCKVEISTTYY